MIPAGVSAPVTYNAGKLSAASGTAGLRIHSAGEKPLIEYSREYDSQADAAPSVSIKVSAFSKPESEASRCGKPLIEHEVSGNFSFPLCHPQSDGAGRYFFKRLLLQ